MAARKHSRQRDSIREFLMTRKDHPSADVIYENVKLQLPNISLGTVYRNLNLLSDLGEIRRMPGFEGVDHFDGRTDPHCHFYCTECHSITDLDEIDSSVILGEASKHFGGEISDFAGRFSGICETCLEKRETQESA